MTTTKEALEPTLEPCRCGRKGLIERFYDGDDPQPLFVATCEVCPIKTYDQFSAEEAARIWNEFVSATVNMPDGQWQHVQIKAGNPRVVAIQFETPEQATAFINSFAAAPASTVAPQQSDEPLKDCPNGCDQYRQKSRDAYCASCGEKLETTPDHASPAALRDETDRVSAFAGSERLSAQEDKPVKNYGDFRAGMLRAAEMARNEFKRAPEAAKGHDCVYMGGYEDACDHLSVVIAQAAVIDSVRIAGPQPDWQYHISLLLPEGIEDQALLKIFQVVEYELRAATTPPSSLAKARAERAAAEMGAPPDEAQTGTSVFLQIPTCGRCPFVDHSGSFTPGGAKTICNHRDAVKTFATNVAGEDHYHWKYRQVNHDAAPPEQCPLRVLIVR